MSIKRKVITLFFDLNTAANRNVKLPIILDMTPDQLIVRQVSYSTTQAAAGLGYQITTDLIDDLQLCVFPDQTSVSNPETHFTISKQFQNSVFSFQCTEYSATSASASGQATNNQAITTTTTGKLLIVLEFLQHPNHQEIDDT